MIAAFWCYAFRLRETGSSFSFCFLNLPRSCICKLPQKFPMLILFLVPIGAFACVFTVFREAPKLNQKIVSRAAFGTLRCGFDVFLQCFVTWKTSFPYPRRPPYFAMLEFAIGCFVYAKLVFLAIDPWKMTQNVPKTMCFFIVF